MERIQALIDKLYHQQQQNSSPAQLLLTVEMLRSELLKFQQKNGVLGTSKVAVTLPVNMNFAEEVIRSAHSEAAEEEVIVPQQSPVAEKTVAPQEPVEYALRKPAVTDDQFAEPVKKYMPAQETVNPAFNLPEETPTLVQSRKELHEVIAEKKESLNDKLKQEKKELAHALKETPIKDLRKAIGINERFTFINELFRGDEAMYERTLKTINSFNIFSEAEYWMNRELKFKLGWTESNEMAQHFYDLVRRRFS
jgi:hypothetical protein